MFEIEVKDVFKISGRGFVIGGEIINRDTVLKNGDTLICRDNKNKKVFVKSLEMVNFGNRDMNLNRIGLLVDLRESEVKSLIGKRLYKEE
ncbi:hypothetical protein D3C78_1248610 [compost metagenome]